MNYYSHDAKRGAFITTFIWKMPATKNAKIIEEMPC